MTVELVDTDASFNPQAGKVLSSFVVDPAVFAAVCAGLPLVTWQANLPLFTDGRINNRSQDAVQTAAIYCEADGSVTIWAVKDSVGTFAFTATWKEINAVPTAPVKNTLIKEAFDIALYRLTSGELQVNAPNNYVFIWKSC